MDLIGIVIAGVIGLAIGVVIALLISKQKNKQKANSIIEEARAEAEVVKDNE